MEWPRVDIDDWAVAGVEAQGRNEHEWLRHRSQPRTWLFKPARADRARSAGEDVAEKLGSEIARLVGVPAAHVVLAERHGVAGALVEDARPSGWELYAGQALMTEVVPDYDPGDRGHRGHNVRDIQRALQRFEPPPQSDLPNDFGAFDVFAGYLAFDALVAHGDRHDRNWAVLVPSPGSAASEALCASFDHAAVLGLLQTEEALRERLLGGTVAEWALRGRASRFEHRGSADMATLVELAAAAAELCEHATGAYWRERISSVDADSISALVESAPGMTETTKQFIVDLVIINRGRLLDVIG